jgi:hypothetical protein
MEQWDYSSDFIYPNGVTLNGVPPPGGWIFYTIQGHRNPCTNIGGTTNFTAFLYAAMYPYQGQNTYPCFDNCPVFAEKPSSVLLTGYPFTYNPAGYDPDLDSLHFEWAQPLINSLQTPLQYYNSGYSYTSPLPGPLQNPNNVPATMNPLTGEISYTSFTQGAFVTATKVSSYRCGILIAETIREMQVVLLPGGANLPPVVTTPFVSDTIFAGELVNFNITAFDTIPMLLPNGDPASVKLEASGSQFGQNYTNALSGCLFPPCATLTPPAPVVGTINVSPSFNWQTSCTHLAEVCNGISSTYNFVFKASDDFCPAPASYTRTVSIHIRDAIMPPPELHCVSVLPNGYVRIDWKMADTLSVGNTFGAYHIFSAATPSGPFTLIDSISDRSVTSYTHTGAAPGQNRYYFIRTLSGCKGDHYSIPSDTLQLINLTVTPSGGDIANLNWNAPHYPLPNSCPGVYQVFREYPPGNWQQIATTSATFYRDSFNLCLDTANYRIELQDSTPCVSVSTVAGRMFFDNTPPDIPVLDSVSIDTLSGSVMLGWKPSTANDVAGYIVFFRSGTWLPLDTVWGGQQTAYHSPAASLCDAAHHYALAAIDSCGNISQPGLNNAHNTLLLELKDFDPCKASIQLSWNEYLNFNPPLFAYHIYVSRDGGPFSLLTSNPAPDSLTAPATTYQHNNLIIGSSYCYYIKAANSAGATSTSCSQCFTVGVADLPDFLFIRYATVEDDHIRLRIAVDTSAASSLYRILRAEKETGPYAQIGSIPFSGATDLSFYDYEASFSRQSYFYRIVAVDSCGLDSWESEISQTIYLSAEAGDDFRNYLIWNDYQLWSWAPVQEYQIYRWSDGSGLPEMVGSTYFGSTTYEDDVSSLGQGHGQFSYRIEALQAPGLPDFRDTARSNTASVRQETSLFIPNAFTPQGLNPVFRPFPLFIGTKDYTFSIFNRWGQEIFHTSSPDQGWDGRHKGKLVPGGVYVCLIRFRRSDGVLVEKAGHVNVVY